MKTMSSAQDVGLSVFDLIRLFKNLPIARLLDMPEVEDAEDLRAWLRAIGDAANYATELTPVLWDDRLVRTLRRVLDNDQAWADIHGFIVDTLAGKKHLVGGVPPEELKPAAEKAGVPWPVLFQVAMLIIDLIKEFREKQEAPFAEQATATKPKNHEPKKEEPKKEEPNEPETND
jgi:hypothetical protein